MRRVAVFMDAGYFWVQVSSLVVGARAARSAISLNHTKLREAVLNEVAGQFPNIDLLRVYWYDGPGPNGKTPEHFAIENLDDFKLRLGTRNGVGQQKAVDGLIIADMISLTQSKAITDALLASGDADMTPGVVAAQAMGLRVHLLEIGSPTATSPHLSAEVDRKRSWTHVDVSTFASPSQVSNASTLTALPSATPVTMNVPSPAAVASPVVAQLPLDLAQIAQSAHSTILGGALAVLLTGLTGSAIQLPPDIDRELLRTARSQAGRILDDVEKRALRVEFKKLL